MPPLPHLLQLSELERRLDALLEPGVAAASWLGVKKTEDDRYNEAEILLQTLVKELANDVPGITPTPDTSGTMPVPRIFDGTQAKAFFKHKNEYMHERVKELETKGFNKGEIADILEITREWLDGHRVGVGNSRPTLESVNLRDASVGLDVFIKEYNPDFKARASKAIGKFKGMFGFGKNK